MPTNQRERKKTRKSDPGKVIITTIKPFLGPLQTSSQSKITIVYANRPEREKTLKSDQGKVIITTIKPFLGPPETSSQLKTTSSERY